MYQPAPALHMVSFENFVKSLPPSLSELKVKPIFWFSIKIRDDPTASSTYALLFYFRKRPSEQHAFAFPMDVGALSVLKISTN